MIVVCAADMARSIAGRSSLRWWCLWLAVFYSGWALLIVLGGHYATLLEHWGIALAMALGSFAAGSTPMGGGTVGFPVLVLWFEQPATLGRDFSFAVQSIGMTSASIFILCRRQPLEWPMLRHAMLGSLLGTPLGIFLIAPHVPDIVIKLVFAIAWGSFGILHLYRLRNFVGFKGLAPDAHEFDRNVGLIVGLVAGLTVASVTGVGIDMVLYAALVLLCRADLKIAIPTSVLIMAFTSVLGIATKASFHGVAPGTYENWLAAAPVVALGAPLGAFIVDKVGRTPTLLSVSVLCLGQFAWTMHSEWLNLGLIGVSCCLAALTASNLAFEWLYQRGAVYYRARSDAPSLEFVR